MTSNIMYGGVTFDINHPNLLFCFQFLFPFLVIILVVIYSCFWLMKKCQCCKDNQDKQDNQDNWAVDADSWAITIAHAIISSTFILYVIALDIAAVIFRDHTPEYHNESYNAPLYHYPGTVLFWDVLAAMITIAVLIFIAFAAKEFNNNAAMNIFHCCCTKQVRAKTVIFLLLKLAGVVPLLSITAHAHYIIITWITDSIYATGILINYAIFYIILLVMLKKSCKRTKQCYDSWTNSKGIRWKVCFGCFAVLVVFAVWFVCLSLQVLVTAFFVYIPINHSIEDTPSSLLTIIHSINAVFLGLIAWKVIVDPRDNATSGEAAASHAGNS